MRMWNIPPLLLCDQHLRGEHFEINKLRFEVLHTRGGAVKWFKVYPAPVDKAPI